MPLDDFESVARAVREGSADCGVLPSANSRVGAIAAVRALLGHPELRVIGEAPLSIRLHLCASAQTTFTQIDMVASHPAALAQCEHFLSRQTWRRVNLGSTAEAARMTAAAADPARACLTSETSASLYGLTILARDVQDEANNHTTFAIIERRDQFA